MSRFAAAWSADNHEAVAGMLAPDAVYFDAQELVRGRAAVAGAWAKSMQASGVMTLTPIHAGGEGTTAYHVGRWRLAAGDGMTQGVYTFIMRRESDGVWRIISAHVEDANA